MQNLIVLYCFVIAGREFPRKKINKLKWLNLEVSEKTELNWASGGKKNAIIVLLSTHQFVRSGVRWKKGRRDSWCWNMNSNYFRYVEALRSLKKLINFLSSESLNLNSGYTFFSRLASTKVILQSTYTKPHGQIYKL